MFIIFTFMFCVLLFEVPRTHITVRDASTFSITIKRQLIILSVEYVKNTV